MASFDSWLDENKTFIGVCILFGGCWLLGRAWAGVKLVIGRIWDSLQFGPDDPGKYPGEQRLKITFEVQPGVSKAWLHYYNEPIGTLELPIGESRS